jgi:23S rRNA pseudouridine2605 synthase
VKYLATAGAASRRASERLVRDGRVRVDDEVVTDPARDVGAAASVTIDGEPVRLGVARLVYAVNKPPGVVSTASDPQRRPTIVSLVPQREARLYPVGRLDIDTTGLILLTNDGELAHRLTHPRFGVPKTYRAVVDSPPVRERALKALREGVALDDGRTAPARVRRIRPDELEITIHEGRKRQVKRMCTSVGHPVRKLQRVAFGPLTLGNLEMGAYRLLTDAEVKRLVESPPGMVAAARDAKHSTASGT